MDVRQEGVLKTPSIEEELREMREYLLYGLMLLLLLIGGVVVFSLVSRQDAVVFATLPLLLVFIPMLFVYLFTAVIAARKARIEGMTIAAKQLNCEFYPEASRQLEREFAAGSLAQLSGTKKIENVISGNKDGCPLRVFTYTHAVRNGKQKITSLYTVALLSNVCPDVPSFRLSPERIWHRLREAVRGENIDFEDTLTGARFSKSYVLQSWIAEDVRELADQAVATKVVLCKRLCDNSGSGGDRNPDLLNS